MANAELERGVSYLFVEKVPEKSYRVFSQHITSGYAGLCLTRTNPRFIREKWGLAFPVVWLAKNEYTDQQVIAPDRLLKISMVIGEFLKAGNRDRRIILLDGVEYLISQNDFNGIMKFLQLVNEYITINNAILILPVYLKSLDSRQIGLLEKEFKVFEEALIVSQMLDSGGSDTVNRK